DEKCERQAVVERDALGPAGAHGPSLAEPGGEVGYLRIGSMDARSVLGRHQRVLEGEEVQARMRFPPVRAPRTPGPQEAEAGAEAAFAYGERLAAGPAFRQAAAAEEDSRLLGKAVAGEEDVAYVERARGERIAPVEVRKRRQAHRARLALRLAAEQPGEQAAL